VAVRREMRNMCCWKAGWETYRLQMASLGLRLTEPWTGTPAATLTFCRLG
jgi:hypothetical protein